MRRKLTPSDLPDIIEEVASYLESTDDSSFERYFVELTKTGIFHDAIGWVVQCSDGCVTVETEY